MEDFIKALSSFDPDLNEDFLRKKIKEEQEACDRVKKMYGDRLTLTFSDGTIEKVNI